MASQARGDHSAIRPDITGGFFKVVLSEVVGFSDAVRVDPDASEGFAVVEQEATATEAFSSVKNAGGRRDPLVSFVSS